MILDAKQERRLQRVATAGTKLVDAKQAAREATDDVKRAVFDAIAADVPIRQVALTAGVERSLVYFWMEQERRAER